MLETDVLIVGGGLAGWAVAERLSAESNLEIVLVERGEIGGNRTTPVAFLDDLNESHLEAAILRRYKEYVLHSPLGAGAAFRYVEEILASIDYSKACTLLFDRASRVKLVRAGAVDWEPNPPQPDRPVIVCLDSGTNICTCLLVDASGASQWAARQLAIKPSPYFSLCHGEFLEGCSLEAKDRFYFLVPNSRYGSGGGWFYPVGENSASMGYARLSKGFPEMSLNPLPGYERAREEFVPYSDWVRRAVVRRTEGGMIPVGRIGRFFDHRVLIVGDAAGQANPWCMMGVNPCLRNAQLCAEAVIRAFEGMRFDRRTLASYEEAWSRSNREPFWRAINAIQPDWVEQSDEGWDKFTRLYQRLSPAEQLRRWRENQASFYERSYAVAGYLRRRFFKTSKESPPVHYRSIRQEVRGKAEGEHDSCVEKTVEEEPSDSCLPAI